MAAPSLFPAGEPLAIHAHRIRLLYFAYFAHVGLMVTFWPYHMQGLGLSAAGIGTLFSVRTVIGIAAQLLLPPIADRSGDPARFLKLCLLLIVVCTAALPIVEEPMLFVALMALATPWESALVTVLDATTIRHAGDRRYGAIRLWGSVGYGLVVALFGWIAADLSHTTAGSLAVPVGVSMLGVAAIAGVALPASTYRRPGAQREPRLALALLKAPGLKLFLSGNVLHWAAVMMFNIFIALHTQDLGLGTLAPGLAVLAAILGEVLALSVARNLLERARTETWLAIVMAVGVVRWWGTAWVDGAAAIIALQALHFFTFGAWLPAVMSQLNRYAPVERRASLQGLYAAVVYGGGGALGTSVGGLIFDAWGGRSVFVAAGIAELAALLLLLVSLARERRQVSE